MIKRIISFTLVIWSFSLIAQQTATSDQKKYADNMNIFLRPQKKTIPLYLPYLNSTRNPTTYYVGPQLTKILKNGKILSLDGNTGLNETDNYNTQGKSVYQYPNKYNNYKNKLPNNILVNQNIGYLTKRDEFDHMPLFTNNFLYWNDDVSSPFYKLNINTYILDTIDIKSQISKIKINYKFIKHPEYHQYVLDDNTLLLMVKNRDFETIRRIPFVAYLSKNGGTTWIDITPKDFYDKILVSEEYDYYYTPIKRNYGYMERNKIAFGFKLKDRSENHKARYFVFDKRTSNFMYYDGPYPSLGQGEYDHDRNIAIINDNFIAINGYMYSFDNINKTLIPKILMYNLKIPTGRSIWCNDSLCFTASGIINFSSKLSYDQYPNLGVVSDPIEFPLATKYDSYHSIPILYPDSTISFHAGESANRQILISKKYDYETFEPLELSYSNITINPLNKKNCLQPGLPIRFKYSIKNLSSEIFLTLRGTIRSLDPRVKITDSIGVYNNVPAKSSALQGDFYEYMVTDKYVNSCDSSQFDDILFSLTLRDSFTGKKYKSIFFVFVRSTGSFKKIDSWLVDDDDIPDSDGNADGIIQKNETIEAYPIFDLFTDSLKKGKTTSSIEYESLVSNTIVQPIKTIGSISPDYVFKYLGGSVTKLPVNVYHFSFVPTINFRNYNFDYNSHKRVNYWVYNNYKIDIPVCAKVFNSQIPLDYTLGFNSDNSAKNKFNIFPVPASNFIYIDSESTNFTYEISNNLGGNLKKGICRENYINIEDLASGLYLLKIVNENQEILLTKFVKQ